MSKTSLNIDQFKEVLRHQVTNNRFIQDQGKVPIATEVEGDSGLGKTSCVLQVAEELGIDCVKLNLSQIEELGDLVGFPIRQFEVQRGTGPDDNVIAWVDEHATEDYVKQGYSFTGNNRTSYCPPEWISGKKAGGFLLLDDWTRADSRFVQATMELIDRQTYISWKLPPDWHIVLSANPDNGDYNVNSTDNAQKTRYISFDLKFDIDCWAKWAEENKMDGRCINFLLMHPELVTQEVNPRSISTFFNSISSFKEFEKNLPMIQLMGEGSVGQEFASMFTLFINNRLDKLIAPKDILFGDEQYVVNTLKKAINASGNYRADIASVLASRIINYSIFYAQDHTIDKAVIDRIANLIMDDIFVNDLRYTIVKGIFTGNKVKFRNLTLNNKLAKYIL